MDRRTLHILIVEDEDAHVELIRRAFAAYDLHSGQFHLTVARGVEEARTCLACDSEPDLVIADLRLPDGRGMELLDATDNHPHFPMVVMTSYGNEQVAVEAIKAGALDYVVKSASTLGDIPRIVERALRQWEHIVERRRTEEALKLSEERYRTLFEDVPVGLYRATPEGEILDANAAFVEMLNYPDRKTLLATSARDLYVDPRVRERWQQLMARRGVVRDFEIQMCCYDGRHIWVEDSSRTVRDGEGRVLHYEGSLRNVTERKRAEEALRASEAEIRRRAVHLATLNAIIATAAAAPGLNELLESTLDRTLEALGLDKGAIWVAGQLALRGLPPEMGRAAHQAAWAAGLEIPEAIVVEDWQKVGPLQEIVATAGPMKRFDVRASITVPILTDGERIGGLSVAASEPRAWSVEEVALVEAVGYQLGETAERLRLLQEVRRQKDELAAAVARLQELDRLKNQFIQNVSHELRTPLALIRGYAEMLDVGELGALQRQQKEPMAVIARRSRMLSEMVEDITLILEAEVNPPEAEAVALDELVHNAIQDFDMTAKQGGLTLEAKISRDLPAVRVAPVYLRRVLDNLLNNALKFTPAGGAITVRARPEGEGVALQVVDSGIGIPQQELASIFERFYQVDGSTTRRYGGTGLGLALVKEILEAYGGRIEVQSRMGQGSTFTAWLPIADERT